MLALSPFTILFLCRVCKYGSQGHSLYILAPAPVPRAAPWAPQPRWGCIPQANSVAQRWPLSLSPWVLLFLDVYKAMLRLYLPSLPRLETSLPCKARCVSGTPASNLPNPSFPLCHIISLSQITTAEQLQLGFLLCLLFSTGQEEEAPNSLCYISVFSNFKC